MNKNAEQELDFCVVFMKMANMGYLLRPLVDNHTLLYILKKLFIGLFKKCKPSFMTKSTLSLEFSLSS